MQSPAVQFDLRPINQLLQQQLPGGSVVLTELPRCRPLKLFLLQSEFNDRDLDQSTIERISDDPPYWIFCWASGYALAQHLMDGKLDVAGKCVVDFGAGSGVVAIAAALQGAAEVVTCEIDPLANRLIALNAQANGVTLRQCCSLDEIGCRIDLLLAADVLYEKQNLHFLDLFLQHADHVLVADSRQKKLQHPDYVQAGSCLTTSYPDFGESLEFNDVRFYEAKKN